MSLLEIISGNLAGDKRQAAHTDRSQKNEHETMDEVPSQPILGNIPGMGR
jgi:hypothetical protein